MCKYNFLKIDDFMNRKTCFSIKKWNISQQLYTLCLIFKFYILPRETFKLYDHTANI